MSWVNSVVATIRVALEQTVIHSEEWHTLVVEEGLDRQDAMYAEMSARGALRGAFSDVISNEVRRRQQALEEREISLQEHAQRQQHKIMLNVGGQRFTTSRDTLLGAVQGETFFGGMLGSGVWEPDDNNEYFIDRDPTFFTNILNYMRFGEWDTEFDATNPTFQREVDFYLLPRPSPTISPGIHHNVPLKVMGGVEVYSGWAKETKTEDIYKDEWLYKYSRMGLGVQYQGSEGIDILAIGDITAAMKVTKGNETTHDGDVYWYCQDRGGFIHFGFAPSAIVCLNTLDSVDIHDPSDARRVSVACGALWGPSIRAGASVNAPSRWRIRMYAW